MMAPARMFSCLSMPSSWILEQSNMAGTRGSMDGLIIEWFCCACAENAPKPKSAINTPARQKTEASKMRRLKNPPSPGLRRAGADCEVDFFFMVEFHGGGLLGYRLLR